MTLDTLAIRPDIFKQSKSRPEFKYLDIRIDYQIPTLPFPSGCYLREKNLEGLSRIVQNGSAVELVARDGYGKSTFTKEMERFNRDQGRDAVRIDMLEQRMIGLTPADDFFRSYITQAQSGKPIFILDGADELWYKEGGTKGKGLTELELDAKVGNLSGKEWRELEIMRRKREYIDWLINHKDEVGIVLSAHDEDTPNARYTDYALEQNYIRVLTLISLAYFTHVILTKTRCCYCGILA